MACAASTEAVRVPTDGIGPLRRCDGRGVQATHEPGAGGKEGVANAVAPSAERVAVGLAELAQHGDGIEERLALPAADGKGWVAAAQRFPALGPVVGRSCEYAFGSEKPPALGVH